MFWWIFGWKSDFISQEATFVVIDATTAKQLSDACVERIVVVVGATTAKQTSGERAERTQLLQRKGCFYFSMSLK